jgi:hypothetical protein
MTTEVIKMRIKVLDDAVQTGEQVRKIMRSCFDDVQQTPVWTPDGEFVEGFRFRDIDDPADEGIMVTTKDDEIILTPGDLDFLKTLLEQLVYGDIRVSYEDKRVTKKSLKGMGK